MSVLDSGYCAAWYLDNYVHSNIQPNSYDLRVNRVFEIRDGLRLYANGTKELPKYHEVNPVVQGGLEWFQFNPGTLYQFESYESIRLPKRVCAITILRSSMNKSGASGEIGLYDSGYEGHCGMTISVKHECMIERGASIAQLLFLKSHGNKLYAGDYLDQKWSEKLLEKE